MLTVDRVGFEPTKLLRTWLSAKLLWTRLGYLSRGVRVLETTLFRIAFESLSAFAVTLFSTVFPLYYPRPMDWVHHA